MNTNFPVEVRNDTNWAVGVTGESVPRRGVSDWILGNMVQRWEYRAYSPPYKDKNLSDEPDPEDTYTNIHTFSDTFTEILFPYSNPRIIKNLLMKFTVQFVQDVDSLKLSG